MWPFLGPFKVLAIFISPVCQTKYSISKKKFRHGLSYRYKNVLVTKVSAVVTQYPTNWLVPVVPTHALIDTICWDKKAYKLGIISGFSSLFFRKNYKKSQKVSIRCVSIRTWVQSLFKFFAKLSNFCPKL